MPKTYEESWTELDKPMYGVPLGTPITWGSINGSYTIFIKYGDTNVKHTRRD